MKKLQRKSWRVDIKWACAILAVIMLTVSLTSLAFYRVAGSSEIVKYQKNALTSSFGLDPKLIGGSKSDLIDTNNLKIKIGDKRYSPEQLDSMSESEFKQLMQEFDGGKSVQNFLSPTSPISKGDSSKTPSMEKIGSMMQDPKIMQNQMGTIASQMMLPYVNNMLGDVAKGMFLTIFIFSLLAAIIFIIAMIGVSYRSGRLMSFSLVLLISAFPVFVLAAFLKTASSLTSQVTGDDPLSLVTILANANFSLFLVIVIVAIVMMLIASVIGIISSITSKEPIPVVPQSQPNSPAPTPKV